MQTSRIKPFFCLVAAILTLFLGLQAAPAGDYGRISIQELKSRLGDRNVLIIDVRDEISWSKSARKIPGAVREDSANVGSWAGQYPKDAEIVLY